MKLKRHQQGLGLIEIMIASLIGLFLLGGVMEMFLGSRQTNRMQDSLSRLQENGRFALEFLTRDVRLAGYIGCSSTATLTNTLNSSGAFLYNFGTAIQGFEAISGSAWSPAAPTSDLSTSLLGGSDIITIRRASEQSFNVASHASASGNIVLDANATVANLKAQGFLDSTGANTCLLAVVSNCNAAAVFQVTGITGSSLAHATSGCTPSNVTANLKALYAGSQVYPISTISYFVATPTSGTRPALYRRTDSTQAQALVEGVEQMQILYGEDTDSPADGAANRYVTADKATMSRVVSVRISLLVVSVDDSVTTEPQAYTYNGTLVSNPGDLRLRRVFTTTLALRNRMQ